MYNKFILFFHFYFYFIFFYLFFDIPLLYHHINFTSSIIFCLSFWDKYFSLGSSLSFSFVTVFALFCYKVSEIFVTLSEILLPIKSPAASASFLIALFKGDLSTSFGDCLAWWRIFWLYLPLKILLRFLPKFFIIFLARDKNPLPFTIVWSLG